MLETTIAGAEALLNLSLLAITFATVTTLVMLGRQLVGGRLSSYEKYLIVSWISAGFVIAVAATLPSIFVLFELAQTTLWAIVSLLAAVLLAARLATVINRRRKVLSEHSLGPAASSIVPSPARVILTFSTQGVSIALLLINAVVPKVQGTGLFIIALTLSLSAVMYAFVHRIGTLLGDEPTKDPERGG